MLQCAGQCGVRTHQSQFRPARATGPARLPCHCPPPDRIFVTRNRCVSRNRALDALRPSAVPGAPFSRSSSPSPVALPRWPRSRRERVPEMFTSAGDDRSDFGVHLRNPCVTSCRLSRQRKFVHFPGKPPAVFGYTPVVFGHDVFGYHTPEIVLRLCQNLREVRESKSLFETKLSRTNNILSRKHLSFGGSFSHRLCHSCVVTHSRELCDVTLLYQSLPGNDEIQIPFETALPDKYEQSSGNHLPTHKALK